MAVEQPIKASAITKPIQLLGAWLTGLLAIDTCFLVAAGKLQVGSWESQALTVAAIINVPIFLVAVFLLQTRFRPELQEDLYYSTYISQKTNSPIQLPKEDTVMAAVLQRVERIENRIISSIAPKNESVEFDFLNIRFGINENLKDHESIAEHLSEVGVVSYSLFGSENLPLKQRVLAIVPGLEPTLEKAILRLGVKAGCVFHACRYIVSRDADTPVSRDVGTFLGSNRTTWLM